VVRDCAHGVWSVHVSTGKPLPCRCMRRLNAVSTVPAPQVRGTLPTSSHLHVHQTRNRHLPFGTSTSLTTLPSLILVSRESPGTFASMPRGFTTRQCPSTTTTILVCTPRRPLVECHVNHHAPPPPCCAGSAPSRCTNRTERSTADGTSPCMMASQEGREVQTWVRHSSFGMSFSETFTNVQPTSPPSVLPLTLRSPYTHPVQFGAHVLRNHPARPPTSPPTPRSTSFHSCHPSGKKKANFRPFFSNSSRNFMEVT
jgi:hypothetical protein